MSTRWSALAPLTCTLLVCACQPERVEEEEEEPGQPRTDACNTLEDALGVAECQLALGQQKSEYIGLPGDQDWFSVQLPATISPRALLHVSAGYSAPNTAVSLSVNVLRVDGKSSIAHEVDLHGQAAPRPLDIITPFREGGARLLVLLSDAQQTTTKKLYDARSPYSLKVELVDDPDANEPNDSKPTPIALAASGDKLTGTATGYLATENDVDPFTVQVPSGRKILHLRISGPKLNPAPPYRLSYFLTDAAGTRVSEGRLDNEFLAVELSTARVTSGGTYTLTIQGYRLDAKPVAGDLRLQYTVDLTVLSEADANEPNDTLETAKATTLNVGGSTTFTGRLGHVPDPDWYALDLPANSKPSVLYYKVTPTSAAGRFPALAGLADRQLRVFNVVTQGASAADRVTACRTSRTACPRKSEPDDFSAGLIDSYCGLSPPRCMLSAREEDAKFTTLRNFEGALPVPPHTATARYYVVVEDDGNNWADDRDYQLKVEWRADTDDENRYVGSAEQAVVRTISEDGAASGFPVPPGGASYELAGKLSYGHGYWRNFDPLRGDGVRANTDYDAFTSDTDRFEVRFPAGITPLERSWELQWEVDHGGGGEAPVDLVLELEFCDGDKSTSTCSVVSRATGGSPLQIGYRGGELGSWHSTGVAGVQRQPVYTKTALSAATQVTALAWGCFCFETRFVKGGKFFLNVVGADRKSYADTAYRIRTAFSSYPKPYNGGVCPVPCQFTKQ